MKKYFKILTKSPLFYGFDENQLDDLLDCLSPKLRSYSKNEIIFNSDEKIDTIGFVLQGKVNIVQDDFWGNRTILSCVEAGNTFAEAFTCAQEEFLSVSAICTQESEIMFLDYAKVISSCSSCCIFHNDLIKNMLKVIASKNVMLTKKIEHLTKRSTREKLLSFLSYQAALNKSNSFSIPYDRQGLADYLAVDRSALSSQLSRLQKEGVLKFNKNKFELV